MIHRLSCARCLLAVLTLTLSFAGCFRPDPAFRLADLTSDDGLIGEWDIDDSKGKTSRVVITGDTQPTDGNRLARRALEPQNEKPRTTPRAEVYTIRAPMDDNDKPAANIVFRCYLLKGDGFTLMGMQHEQTTDLNDKPIRFTNAFALPMQMFARLDRDGDTITLRFPRHGIVLIPAARFIDEAPTPSDGRCETLEQAVVDEPPESARVLLCANPDRLLQVYRRYGDDATFWNTEGTIVMRRVISPTPAAKP